MFIISKRNNLVIKGETCGGIQSAGTGQDYLINFDGGQISAIVRYNKWQNGERDITCLEASGDPKLNTVIGRMRLSIDRQSPELDYVTLKTAIIKREPPAHANLHKRDLQFYKEIMETDLIAALSIFGNCKVDTKEVLLNSTGRNRTELCMLFPSRSEIQPVAAFVLTRIYPILLSDRPLFQSHIILTGIGKI